jgi:flagellar rod assembly protein/muramidase FlgJ
MAPKIFIQLITPAAQASMRASGVPASFIVAQAALESGWGESRLAREGNNLFGVKAHASWRGDILTLNTREFLNGSWITVPAHWRQYADWSECLLDHAAFLQQNPRYAACFECSSGETFAQAVARAGYATDPDYAAKLIAIIRSHDLAGLDQGPLP